MPNIANTAATPASLDLLVDATPPTRDRYVDFLRALSIVVVVAWHWVFSITQWNHGRLAMPNPIQYAPWLWPATWVLQIMPVFFFVGGFANAASWESLRGRGGDWGEFAQRRLARLYRPLTAFFVVWAAVETALTLARPGYTGVLHYGLVVFVPLWFLVIYTAVVLLTPATTALHRRFGVRAVLALGAMIALADGGRFGLGVGPLGWLNSALVWLFAHQLGYLYQDGTLERIGRRGQAAVAALGLGALVGLTTFGPYPRSMVAIGRDPIGNMFPTTACIASLAVFQAGLAMLLRPAANRLLQRRRAWRSVIAANSVAMTVYIWHMTAVLIVIEAVHLAGFHLLRRPTEVWWLGRWFWVLAPAAVLAVLVAVFGRIEQRQASPSR